MDNGQEWKRVDTTQMSSDSEEQHGNEQRYGTREGRTGSGRYNNNAGGERRYSQGYGSGERRYSSQGNGGGERRYSQQNNNGERRYAPQGNGNERRYSSQGNGGGERRYYQQGNGGGEQRYQQGNGGGERRYQQGGGERRYSQQGNGGGHYSAPSHSYGNRMQDPDFNYERGDNSGYDSGYIDLNSAVDHVPGKSKRKRIVKKVGATSEGQPYQKVNMQRPPMMRKKTPPPPPKKRAKPFVPEYPDVPFEGPVRLNRYIANTGLCSRREADDNIKQGFIKVNGQVVTEMGQRVDPTKDEVLFKDKPISSQRKVYLLLNKPKGFVTSMSDPNSKKLVMDLVRAACKERIYPVGRLDKMTTGVLLFTNDGDLSLKLTHPSNRMRKVYQVMLDKPLTDEDMDKLSKGIELEDGAINFDSIAFTDPDTRHMVGVEIHSGKNRIVRRMFEAVGYKVVKLDRVYFAGLTRKGLKRGKWRFLSPEEVAFLKMMPSS